MSKFSYLVINKISAIDISGKKGESYDHYAFQSTDSSILDLLSKKMSDTSFTVTGIKEFPSGKKYGIAVNKVDPEVSDSLKWWFFSLLGHLGWEPFAIEPKPQKDATIIGLISLSEEETWHLRKREDD